MAQGSNARLFRLLSERLPFSGRRVALHKPWTTLNHAVGTSVDCTTFSTGTLTAAGLSAGNELGFAGLLCVATTRLPNLGVVWRVMNSVCTGNLAAARRRAYGCNRISYPFDR